MASVSNRVYNMAYIVRPSIIHILIIVPVLRFVNRFLAFSRRVLENSFNRIVQGILLRGLGDFGKSILWLMLQSGYHQASAG